MAREAQSAVVLRYRDGRTDRGLLQELGPGLVRVEILRGREPAIQAALPLSIVEAIYFVSDLGQPPLSTLSQLEPRRPAPGKVVEVHLARWSIRGTRVEGDESGFFLVPADPRSNTTRIFFPEGAPRLVETSDLPSPAVDPEEESSVRPPAARAPSPSLRPPPPPMPPLEELDPFAGGLVSSPPNWDLPPTPPARVLGPADSSPPRGPPSIPRSVPPASFPAMSLPPLPPLAAVVPPGSAPLLPAEVEALIRFDALRPPSPPLATLGFWADPWAPPSPARRVSQAPENLLPFRGSMDLPRVSAVPEDPGEDWELTIENPASGDIAPSFAYAIQDLLDNE